MALDSSPSQVATSALQAIPFGSIIGGPLKACIEAQAMAAQTSWQFIQEVGLNTDTSGRKEAVNVTFEFLQNGRKSKLNVPLLTIVPIPYIAIQTIDINFKANISASASSVSETSSSENLDVGGEITAKFGKGPFSVEANIKANYSSKKDSKATQESQYSVEYTMDVAVHAGQDSMPAGLAKVLELLGNTLDVVNPDGELEVSDTSLVVPTTGSVKLIATYKNPDGLYKPDEITLKPDSTSGSEIKGTGDGTNMVFDLNATNCADGYYIVSAGDKKTVKVNVQMAKTS
ncbi:Protein of unknown function [Prevotella aff. ruminicola Tc2-24]|uniref:DUF2589 domain-containing protein n=1 Tax=Prevotella aff. ruminicola Tc2-24 TaxID=81582 RepID=A0A1I0M8B7_9BACT|nr:DUF2589 domain-containing protein [Prevotella aff. ruminicola Tc2-24]SEV84000.1 Protein of unknown function [Prevotella aff. ruminicola Tc2-24]